MIQTNEQIEKLIDDIKAYADVLHQNKEMAKSNQQNYKTEAIKIMYLNLQYSVNNLQEYLK